VALIDVARQFASLGEVRQKFARKKKKKVLFHRAWPEIVAHSGKEAKIH
jgi:hypothetical protein